jgi:glycosyltransferase involved in cell wall biosynthesis
MLLSIIIPTFNRSALLKRTLGSIAGQQEAGGGYEVIVVDNGSADDTRAVCTEMAERIPNLVYHFDAEPGLLTGRHVGIARSKGEILSFIDDDVELNPAWIASVKRIFDQHPGISIAGGPSLPRYHAYPPEWLRYFWQPTPYGGSMCLPLSLIDIGRNELEVDPVYIFGLNYSIRKTQLLELGGFHPDCLPAHLQRFQGDGETGLSIKAGHKKLKALFSGTAFMYHQVVPERMTHSYFKKWHYYSGVCNSFTDIRMKHRLYPAAVSGKGNFQLYDKVRNTTRHIQSFLRKASSSQPGEITRLQSCFHEGYMEGYSFHRHAFETDPAVKKWVLKHDYWNYTLPS